MGEDELGVGELAGQPDGVLPQGRDAAARVDEHGHGPLVGQRDEAAHRRRVHRELLRARVQLDAAGARVEAAARLGDRRVAAWGWTRQNANSRPSDSRAARMAMSLGPR